MAALLFGNFACHGPFMQKGCLEARTEQSQTNCNRLRHSKSLGIPRIFATISIIQQLPKKPPTKQTLTKIDQTAKSCENGPNSFTLWHRIHQLRRGRFPS
jgi:hypothetical protein